MLIKLLWLWDRSFLLNRASKVPHIDSSQRMIPAFHVNLNYGSGASFPRVSSPRDKLNRVLCGFHVFVICSTRPVFRKDLSKNGQVSELEQSKRSEEEFIMAELEYSRNHLTSVAPGPSASNRTAFHHVLACVDSSACAHTVLAHAAATAQAMGAQLTVLRVLEPSAARHAPTDPVEWDLRHHEAVAEVERLASGVNDHVHADALVIEGMAAERICEWASEHDVDLTVLGISGENGCEWGLGRTARRVAETAPGSVLLCPTTEVIKGALNYHRLMIPLDCSSRAECALPIAASMADAHNADLLLVHASPEVALTEVGPPEADDLALRERLRKRNRRVAQRYLQQTQARLSLTGGTSRVRMLPTNDPRHAIMRAVSDEEIDILVLSSSGCSGHPDLSLGSVADYLICHITTPILLVRSHTTQSLPRLRNSTVKLHPRLPGQAQP